MSVELAFRQRLLRRLASFSICARIAIGNAFIIALGATAGIAVTRALTARGASDLLILLIVLLDLALSIAASYAITHLALQPLFELRRAADRAKADPSNAAASFWLTNPDPDTRHLASALRALVSQLESSNRQLKAINSRAISAQEEERKRISHWLHDDTGQALANLILQLERLEPRLPENDPETRERVVAARQLAVESLAGLRKIIHGLRPSILDDLGLVPAIRWYARTNLEEAGIQTTVQAPDICPTLPPELNITLFRIAQEAINNIVRHSQARQADITIVCGEKEISLCIKDDGRGFTVADDTDEAIRKRHWGLIGIQERLERIGGSLNLASEPGQGTLLQINAPLPRTKEFTDE